MARPIPAVAQSPAAVVSPRTNCFCIMIVPAPMKPMPLTTCAATRLGSSPMPGCPTTSPNPHCEMMMMSALPAAGAVDVSHLNGTDSSTLTQAAADTLPSLSIAPMTELATVVSYENGDLTVKTADGDELVLHTENAIVMDTQTAAAADLSALKAGESVYVYHDEAVTMSLPAQTTAYAVLTNLTDKHAPASLLTAEAVQKNDDGSVTVTCQSGALHLTIAKDASVQPFMTRNIVTVDDIHVGTRFLAWFDVAATSYPAQAAADRVVIPGQEDSRFLVFSKDGSQLTEGCVADGVAMVPVRKVAENLGYKVSWDGKTNTVILEKGETPINVQLGVDRYHAGNDRTGGVSLGSASYEINGTSWVPAELFQLAGETISFSNGSLTLGSLMLTAVAE